MRSYTRYVPIQGAGRKAASQANAELDVKYK